MRCREATRDSEVTQGWHQWSYHLSIAQKDEGSEKLLEPRDERAMENRPP